MAERFEGGTWISDADGNRVQLFPEADIDGNGTIRECVAGYLITTTPVQFNGFGEPLNADGSSIFKLGSTIAFRFPLTDAEGNPLTSAVAKLYLSKLTDDVLGTEMEAQSTGAATEGNQFVINGDQYMFNLSTKNLSPGTWQARVELDSGESYSSRFSLK